MEAAFRDCVDEERRGGRTVLLSSHILAEAEALADRVTIIRDGRTAETGTLAEMRHLTRTTVDAELAGPVSLDGLTGVHAVDRQGTKLRCEVDHAALNDLLARLTKAGVVPSPAGRRPWRSSFSVFILPNGPWREFRDDRLGPSAGRSVPAAWSGPARWPGSPCAGTGSRCPPSST